jgi:hypothetical protein
MLRLRTDRFDVVTGILLSAAAHRGSMDFSLELAGPR